MSNSNRTYEPVDCESLATLLAEEAWEEEVRSEGVTKDELYEDPEADDKVIRPRWAYNFFAIREKYLDLINSHKKEQLCISPVSRT